MNISDKQLTALINYIRLEAQTYAQFVPAPNHEVKAARKNLCEAFGFTPDKRGYPETPVVPQTAGPTTEHQQAEAAADYDNKHEAVAELLNGNIDAFHIRAIAHDLMRLWPELKAIMEPASVLVSQQPFRHPTFCVSCGVQIFKGEHHECEA